MSSNNRREKKSTAMNLKKIAGQLNTEGVPKILKIDSLIDHPDNDYVFGVKEIDIVNMAMGIKQNGFRGAIEVWDLGDGTYMIYSGHVRKEGVKYNGGDEIRAFVYEYPESEAQRRRLFLGANIYGRNKLDVNDPVHMARQIAYHRETLKMEGVDKDLRSILASEFGISGSNIQRYEAILNLTPEIQEKTESGELPITIAAAIGGIKDEETQEETVKAIEEFKEEHGEVTRDTMKNFVSEVKKTGDVKKAAERLYQRSTPDDEAVEADEITTENDREAEPKETPLPTVKTTTEQWKPEIEEDDNEIIYEDDFIDDTEENTVPEEPDNDKIVIEASEKMMDVLTANYEYANIEKVLKELEDVKTLIEEEIARLHKQ